MSDIGKVVEKLETIEELFKQNLVQYREETVKQIESVWKDQVRQDDNIQELLQQRAVCLEEFDDKIRASEIGTEKKIEDVDDKIKYTEKGWWKKIAIIYSVVILIVGFLAVHGMGMKDDVAAKLGKDEFYQWKRTELSDVKQEIRDLRKEIKEGIKDFNEILKGHVKELKKTDKNLK